MHSQGRYDFEVIRVQTACELLIAEAVKKLAAALSADVDASKLLRRPMTLRDDQSLALLHLLTGRRIQQEPWWSDYIDHLRRRHAVLHAGVAVDRDGSQASLKVNLELQSWLLEVREGDVNATPSP